MTSPSKKNPFDVTEENLAFFQLANETSDIEKEKEEPITKQPQTEFVKKKYKPSSSQSLLNSLSKGFFKGVQQLGETISSVDQPFGLFPQQDPERFNLIDETFPTKDLDNPENMIQEIFNPIQKNVESILETGAEIFPSLVGGNVPGTTQNVIRSLTGGSSKQLAKNFGFGEMGQSIAEAIGTLSPDILQKKIPSRILSKEQEQSLNFLRNQGLNEEQITPIFKKQNIIKKMFSKVIPRRGKSQNVLETVRAGQDLLFENLRKSPLSRQKLSTVQAENLMENIDSLLLKMPVNERNKILSDLSELNSSLFTGSDLVNFWQDINSQFGRSKQTQILKGPLQKAIKQISPEFNDAFKQVNKFAGRFQELQKSLKPNVASDIVEGGKALEALYAMSTKNPQAIKVALGAYIAPLAAREIIVNPRLQNIGTRIVNATNNQKWGQALRLSREFIGELEIINPIFTEEINEDEVEAFFKSKINQK